MNDIKIRQGETLTLTIESDDLTAQTVRFVARKDTDPIIISVTANFETVDGKRVATISTSDTIIAAETYSYMLVVTYEDETISKLPDTANCGEDCDLPSLIICEALDLEVS